MLQMLGEFGWFVVLILAVVVFFGFLLRKEYHWIKQNEMDESVGKRLIPWAVTLVTGVIGLCIVAAMVFYLMFAVAMHQAAVEQSKIVNLNPNTEILAVGDTWNVDDKGSVTVNSITQLSTLEAQQKYGVSLDDAEQYYELSFDYENIAFDGYLEEEQVIEDTMQLTVYVSSVDADGLPAEAWLDTAGEAHEYYAMQGRVMKDQRFLIMVEELENLHSIEISFTIYTPDKYGIYRQDFRYEV